MPRKNKNVVLYCNEYTIGRKSYVRGQRSSVVAELYVGDLFFCDLVCTYFNRLMVIEEFKSVALLNEVSVRTKKPDRRSGLGKLLNYCS